MKVFAVPVVTYKAQNSFNKKLQNQQQFSNVSFTNPLACDTVSFKSKEDDTVCDSFGLMKRNCQDVDNDLAGQDINNLFNVMQRENEVGGTVLDYFVWNSKNGKVQFFGDDRGLARFLESNKDARDFRAEADANSVKISYDKDNFHYDLKYDTDTHELKSAGAVSAKDKENNSFETISLKPSKNHEGKYIVDYRYHSDKNSESAYENTSILFDEDMRVQTSSTEKRFQYSDGHKTEEKFTRLYDENGYSEETDSNTFEF